MRDFDNDFEDAFLSEIEIKSKNLYKLAANRRAIANFVSIVTGKSIPVSFSVRGDSYTDGERVVISSNITEPDQFDPAVGLALHEGSHIKLSDFNLLRDLESTIHRLVGTEISDLASQKGISYFTTIKDILNWVEDRRIDNYIYTNAPGYRDYYRALYDKYFNDPLIDKGLKSDEYTSEEIESYMFRLINLQSKFTNIRALKALPAIAKVADLKNISRLKTTEDALKVAIDIFRLILNAIPDKVKNKPKQQASGDGDGSPQQSAGGGRSYREPEEVEGGSGGGSGDEGEEGDEEETEGNGSGNSDQTEGDADDMEGDTDGGSGDENGMETSANGGEGNDTDSDSPSTPSGSTNKTGNPTTLSDKQKELLKKKIQKQKDFGAGKIKKQSVTKTEAETLNTIEESGAETEVVGQDVRNHYGNIQKGVECIVVKNMTRSLIESPSFPLTNRYWDSSKRDYTLSSPSSDAVEKGIQLGTLLGKRLQTRSESRDTIFNRQKIGKMDRRMISTLGFGNENVFYTKETDQYKKANLHISLDASGSMNGKKWKETLTNAVALAKACDMISNLNIQISVRTTTDNSLPYVLIAYDSRKDKISKIKSLFPHLTAGGTTPEGLCFEAIRKYIVESTNDTDSYFLNISDGEPYYEGKTFLYYGDEAAKHTKKMVDYMSGIGIKVLSYFVSESNLGEASTSGRVFRKCYGKSASYINVTSMLEVSRTMNKLFMEK